MFFGFYGSPIVQSLLGVGRNSIARPVLEMSPETLAVSQARSDAYAAKLETGGFDEALTRAVLYVIAANRSLDQRCALALNVARQQFMHLSLAEFKALVREQFFILQTEPERAIDMLARLVTEVRGRTELLEQVRAIASAGDPLTATEGERFTRLSRVLAPPIEPPAASGRLLDTAPANRSDIVLH
jgi:hypothetical protein